MATTSEEVWRILGALAEAQKETARQAKEAERRPEQQFREAD